jgi:hypothetical protein
VSVVVLIATSTSGRRSASARTSDCAAFTSPTDTPWTRTRGRELAGGSGSPKPRRARPIARNFGSTTHRAIHHGEPRTIASTQHAS